MKNNNQVEYEIEDISNKPTPRLDALVKKVNKLLGASCATFIPKACDALKDDWFPNMSDKTLKENAAVQQEMRNKIISKFAKESSEDGVWKESSIRQFLPDYLKYQEYQESNTAEKQRLSVAAKLANKYLQNLENVGTQQTLLELTDNLPEPPAEPKPEIEPYTGGGGKKTSTPQELYEDGVRAAEKIWIALTGEKGLYVADRTDALIEYIKPTRAYRLRIFKGLNQAEAIDYQRTLVWLDMLIQDTLKMCLEFSKENKNNEVSK